MRLCLGYHNKLEIKNCIHSPIFFSLIIYSAIFYASLLIFHFIIKKKRKFLKRLNKKKI